MGKYKYFEEIITKRNNVEFADIVGEVIERLLKDLIKSLISDEEDWLQKYILKPDREERENNRKILLPTKVKPVLELLGNGLADYDHVIKHLDLQAKTKLIQFRLLSQNNKNESSLGSLMKETREFRNDYIGHWTEAEAEAVTNDKMVQRLSILTNKMEDAKSSCDGEIKEIINRFLEDEWIPLLNDYNLSIGRGAKINRYENGLIDAEQLYHYHILLEYTVFFSRYYRAIQDVLYPICDKGGKKLFVEIGTVEQLNETARGQGPDSGNAKSRLKELELWQQKDDLVVLRGRKENVYRADNIVTELSERKGERWCIVTEDDILARELYALNKNLYVVVRPCEKDKFRIFTGEIADSEKEDHTGMLSFHVESQNDSDAISVQQEATRESAYIPREPEKLSSEKPGRKKGISAIPKIIPKSGYGVLLGRPEDEYSYPVKLGNEISHGGEGVIYAIEDMPDLCIKIYNKDKWSENRIEKVKQMVEARSELNLPEEICWPRELVYDKPGKSIVGYSMRKVGYLQTEDRFVDSVEKLLLKMSIQEVEWSRTNLLDLCLLINDQFRYLHDKNILMGDVNPENIMVEWIKNSEDSTDVVRDMNVYFIDTDSYQFKDFVCPVGTEEYTSRRIYNKYPKVDYSKFKREISDEYFSMAILYFHILFIMGFPYDTGEKGSIRESIENCRFRFNRPKQIKRNFIWKNLSEEIRDIFKKVFTDSKELNTTVGEKEWKSAFREMVRLISEQRLSDELWPTSAIEDPERDYWRQIPCKKCNKKFWIAKPEQDLRYDDDWCPDCKIKRNLTRKKIYRLKCMKCGKLWTVNAWDAAGKDSEKLLCPDCDSNFDFYNESRYLLDGSDETRKKLETAMSFAFKYLQQGDDEE